MLVFAINGIGMYIVIGACFAFAITDDLLVNPKYVKLKEKYKQFKNQDEYLEMNKDGTK